MNTGATLGLLRSLCVYYAQPWRRRALSRFYDELIPAGSLAFDVGAHVGSRTRTLLGRCEHVVAIEPQPVFARWLERLFARNARVTLVTRAVGAMPGQAELRISSRHPTVSSLSGEWVARVGGSAGFERVAWDETVTVAVTTLDALIAEHGLPHFCKLDVEGLEAQILAGLSRPIALMAFEYLPATPDIAVACIDRLEQLGRYEYNISTGESHRLLLDEWCDAKAARDWLATVARDGSGGSGDVYARRSSHHSAGSEPPSDTNP